MRPVAMAATAGLRLPRGRRCVALGPWQGPWAGASRAVRCYAAPRGPDYAELKVVELKELLRARSLPVSGRKAELIERLVGADERGAAPPTPPAPRPPRPAAPQDPGTAAPPRLPPLPGPSGGAGPFRRRTCDQDFDAAKHYKIVTWNVNGLRARLRGPEFEDFVARERPDVLCLQETKLQEGAAPDVGVIPGYVMYCTCSTARLGYSGTRTYVRRELAPAAAHFGLAGGRHNAEGRCVTVRLPGLAIVNTYVPNAGERLQRLHYRTQVWDPALREYLRELLRETPVVWTGDLNVAERDYDRFMGSSWAKMQQIAGFTPEERLSFRRTVGPGAGLTDAFRMLYPGATEAYTYWSARGGQRAKGNGWRLDYFVVSEALRTRVVDVFAQPDVMGSDHCPVSLWLSKAEA